MIQRLLFESPFTLAAVCVGIQGLLLLLWRQRPGRVTARAVWLGAAAIPILIGMSIVVVTPRERIIAICHELAIYVDEVNIAGIAVHISDDFETDGFDRTALLDGIERALTTVRVDNLRLRRFEVTFSDEDTALATFSATCRVRSNDFQQERLSSRWGITFRLSNDRRLIERIESIPVPPLHFRRLGEWLR